jgi:outer membrane protein assembly factor BamB
MKKILIVWLFAVAFMLSFASGGFALYSSTDPWPMYRHDVAHTGATASGVPSSNSTLWAKGFSTYGLSVTTTPLVIDGRVIFAVRDLAVAVDETTGVELWRHQCSGALAASSYADGRVYFGQSDGTGGIVCINATTGAEIWTQDLSPNFVTSSPLVGGGIVYAGTTDNYTRAFNATTGQYKWGYKTGGPVYSSPAKRGDHLFFGSDDAKLYALDVSGPTPVSLWNFTANAAVRSTPAIGGGLVFFGSDDKTLYALNETTGELIWSWATTSASRIRCGVAIANNIVYVVPESTTGYTADMGKIFALHADASPGNYTEDAFDIRYWRKQFPGFNFNEPVYAGGRLVLTTTSGGPARLYALDADVGTVLWERIVNWWPGIGNPVVADGRVWFSAYWWDPGSFTLYCIGDPFPPSTSHYIVNAGGQSFDVAIETNSTIKNFNTTALETEGKISFDVQGIGTTGMSNVTIPNTMLDGEYNVTVDGEQPLYSAPPLNNGTHTSLYFTYNITSPHTVEITGTKFIPEFQALFIAPLMIAVSFVILLLKSRRIAKLRQPTLFFSL